MIDLHIHTNYSDGAATVKEILEKAEKQKLAYIAITDHETCDAYEELKKLEIKKLFSGTIIPGIELKSAYQGRIIDILGYGIDTVKMNEKVKEFYKEKTHANLQRKYLKQLYKTGEELGLTLTPMEELTWNPDNDWANPTMYAEMKKHPENEEKLPKDLWEDFDNFRHKYAYNKENVFYVDKSEDYFTVMQTMNLIKECGGKVFLPHLFIYKWAEDKESFIKDLIQQYPVDGIECYYSLFSEEQTKYLLDLCNKKKLLKSGGSDYHGNSNKPGVELGIGKGNLKIPNEIVLEWI